jgi:hypothetical protein
MKPYRVGFSRTAAAQIEMIEAWLRENHPAAPDMFSRELEAAVRLLEISPPDRKGVPVSSTIIRTGERVATCIPGAASLAKRPTNSPKSPSPAIQRRAVATVDAVK